MKAELVGRGQRITGTGKTGKKYDGQTLYFLYEKPNIEGTATQEQFVSTDPNIKLGDTVSLDYDNKGYLMSIEVIE